jgi:pimeloyl-ACP methyl ester carboxylesterase
MNYRPPLVLRARESRSGGGLTAAKSPWGSLTGSTRLTIFVHGFNVGQDSAEDVWEKTHELLREPPNSVPPKRLNRLLLFYWPGDLRLDLLSKLNYFRTVDVAVRAGRLLADKLSSIGTPGSPLRVDFVGHSLGCRVVLSALAALRDTESVRVRHVILMAAAVPEGLCEDDRPYGSGQVAGQTSTIIYSLSDRVLRRAFPLGQWAARHRINLPDVDPGIKRVAVGFQGGPADRWNGEYESCDLDHGEYWNDPRNVGKLVPLFGKPKDRQVRSRDRTAARLIPDRAVRTPRRPPYRRPR